MYWRAAAIGLGFGWPAAPLAAQDATYQYQEPHADSDKLTAEQALKRNEAVYGPPPPRRNCRADPQNAEIVVCAEEEEDQSKYRVQSTAELDPKGPEATDDGIPRAPDFRPPPCVPNLLTICVDVGQPPPPTIMFDISELPEAPEGSDADLIAKGKKRAD